MPTILQDIDRYLNPFFAREVWQATFDYLENQTVSRFANELIRTPSGLINGLDKPVVDFSNPPSVKVINNKSAQLKLPGKGNHLLTADIAIKDPIPDPDFRIEPKHTINIGDSTIRATSQSEVDFDLPFLAKAIIASLYAFSPFGVGVALANSAIDESIIEDQIRDRMLKKYQTELSTYRFDNTIDIVKSTIANALIEGPLNIPFSGSSDPKKQGYIDILLVNDNFGSIQIVNGTHVPPEIDVAVEIANLNLGGISQAFRDILRASAPNGTTDSQWRQISNRLSVFVSKPNQRWIITLASLDRVLVVVREGNRLTYFDADDFTRFTHLVGAHFANEEIKPPFLNFKSGIRIWKAHRITSSRNPDAGNPNNSICHVLSKDYVKEQFGEEFLANADISRGTKLNFANLAILAKMGLVAEEFFWKHPIVVCVHRSDFALANAQGPYVLLQYPKENGAPRMALTTLLHELGHTPLGNLADEYTLTLGDPESTQDADDEGIYLAKEPTAVNVSKYPLPVKWVGMRQIFPGAAVQGAYNHKKGIFRFQRVCQMENSNSILDFCPICREGLTKGMAKWAHEAVGQGTQRGFARIQLDYLSPKFHSVIVDTTAGRIEMLNIAHQTATRMRLSVLATSVPEDWEITWNLHNEHDAFQGGLQDRTYTGPEVTIDAIRGTTIELRIRHARFRTTPRIISDQITPPEFSGTFNVNDSMQLQVLTPTDLGMSRDPESRNQVERNLNVQLIIDNDGKVHFVDEITLSAVARGVYNSDELTGLEFRLLQLTNSGRPSSFTLEKSYGQLAPGTWRRWRLPKCLPSGRYKWEVRAYWRGYAGGNAIYSGWVSPRQCNPGCFHVEAPLSFRLGPRGAVAPPVDPFGLNVGEEFFGPGGTVSLVAISWHPNDKRIKFRFEAKLSSESWQQAQINETNLLQRSSNICDSMRIKGIIGYSQPVGAIQDIYQWRVKAIDEDGVESNWVEGPQFRISFRDPVDWEEWMRTMERINPEVMESIRNWSRPPRGGPIP